MASWSEFLEDWDELRWLSKSKGVRLEKQVDYPGDPFLQRD